MATITHKYDHCGCLMVITDGELDSRTRTCARHEVSTAFGNVTLKPRLAEWEERFLATYPEVSKLWPL